MAKIRVEVDLTPFLWGPSPPKGFYQKLEYENVPKFCRRCKILGHSITQCRKIEQKKNEEKAAVQNQIKDRDVAESSGTNENEAATRTINQSKNQEDKKDNTNEAMEIGMPTRKGWQWKIGQQEETTAKRS